MPGGKEEPSELELKVSVGHLTCYMDAGLNSSTWGDTAAPHPSHFSSTWLVGLILFKTVISHVAQVSF